MLELAEMARNGGGGAQLFRARRSAARAWRGRIGETKKVRFEEGRSVWQRTLKTRNLTVATQRSTMRQHDHRSGAARSDKQNNKAAQHGSAGARQHGQHGAAHAVVRARCFAFYALDARFERNGGR